jgi:hypothetical protein
MKDHDGLVGDGRLGRARPGGRQGTGRGQQETGRGQQETGR